MKAIAILSSFALGLFAAEVPKAPVPPSPYLPVIYRFADAMLEKGRDTNGLFHTALDRSTMTPLTNPASANPQHNQNFLRLLYTLSDLSAKPKYRDAADVELRWFMEKAGSRGHLWERPWMLWDRCFALAPQASARLARGTTESPEGESPQHAGFYIRAWASAYTHTRDKEFLDSIERVLNHFEEKRNPAGNFVAARELRGSVAPLLSMAIDCDAAARLVPPPLARRLEACAAREDDNFFAPAHDVRRTGGFIASANYLSRVIRESRTLPWKGPQDITTAQVGMMCVSRYENTGDVRYRELIHAAADVYLTSPPDSQPELTPRMLGHAISLQVAAWRSTAQQQYLDRARALADFAVKHLFDQGPLPRASLHSDHYEAASGADTLALGLVELHLHILGITAVRYPPNTIDR